LFCVEDYKRPLSGLSNSPQTRTITTSEFSLVDKGIVPLINLA